MDPVLPISSPLNEGFLYPGKMGEPVKNFDCLKDEAFCGDCVNCHEWERTADIEGYEEKKRQRIAEEQEY